MRNRSMNPSRSLLAQPSWLLPAVFVLAFSPGGRTEQLFEGGVSFSVDSPPVSLVLEDFNRDGRIDVAALGAAGVSVLLGLEGEIFGAPWQYDAGLGAISLAVGDLNGDQFSDLVIANGGASTLSILLNRGDATFAPQADVPVGLSPRVVALDDFSSDGILDAVTSNFQAQSVGVLIGDGRGGLVETTNFQVGDNPHALVTGDYQGDGRPDLVVAHSGAVTWFRGVGDGSFGGGVDTPLFPDPRLLAGGDTNSDSLLDLAVITDERNLLHLENLGQGAFREEPVATLPRGNIFERMLQPLLVDFTADGCTDIVALITGPKDSRLQIHANDGAGSFVNTGAYFLSAPTNGVAVADVDSDGTLDVVAARADAAEAIFFQGTGSGSISSRRSVPLDAGPRDILALDSDEDGALGLLALSSDAFWVVEQDGHGSFEPPRAQRLPGSAFQDIAPGDFNGDTRPEIALADLAGNRAIVAFLEKGTLTRAVEHPLLGLPAQLVAADFDGDGWDDLAVTDQAAVNVLLLFRAGESATSVAMELPVGASQTSMTVADFDGDGALDLALAARDGGRVFLGDGARSFPRSLRLDGLASSPSIRASDLDDDGTVDLIGVSRSKVVVFYSVAAPTGPRKLEIDVGTELRPLEIRDVNADGRQDLVTAMSSSLAVIRGAQGGFEQPQKYAVGSSPRAVALGDFNGDSRVDAATADFGDRSISILHGRPSSLDSLFKRGDADASSVVNVTDAVRILAALFQGAGPPPCADAADTNDDGMLSLTDAVALLLHLFQGGPAPPAPGTASCGRDPTRDALGPCAPSCG